MAGWKPALRACLKLPACHAPIPGGILTVFARPMVSGRFTAPAPSSYNTCSTPPECQKVPAGPCPRVVPARQDPPNSERSNLMLRRCFLRSLAAAQAAGLVHVPLVLPWEAIAQQRGGMAPADPFKPSEEANHPMGAGKGIHPGRVAWVRDASATSWDGVTGHWWDDALYQPKSRPRHDFPAAAESDGKKEREAGVGRAVPEFQRYPQAGEFRISSRRADRHQDQLQPGPVAGVGHGGPSRARGRQAGPSERLAQPSRGRRPGHGTDRNGRGAGRGHPALRCHRALATSVSRSTTGSGRIPIAQFQAVKFLVGTDYNLGGRMSPTPDMANPIRFSKAELPTGYLPRQVTEAKYMINMALLRPHGMAGVTLERQEPLRLRAFSERWRLVPEDPAQQRHADAAHGLLQRPGGPDGAPPPGRQNHAFHPGRPVYRGAQ